MNQLNERARPFCVMGNWKMHGTQAQAQALVQRLVEHVKQVPTLVDVVICPPVTLLHQVQHWLHAADVDVMVGGQDCHTHTHGAYTGDISAEQLKDAGASWVIVGHSERRQYHNESDALIREKAIAALSAGIIPVVCVGETLAQREAGQTMDVVCAQVLASVPEQDGHIYIAYEPVWAIGTGKVPTLEDIERVHTGIIDLLTRERAIDVDRLTVLYGGSVKATNAREIRAVSGVGGMLVGGASLEAADFSAIIDAAA